MRLTITRLLLCLLTLICCGCMNPYAKYYKDLTNGYDINSSPFIEKSGSPPRLIPTNDPDKTARQLREDGYSPIGYSSFWGGDYNESRAIEQAEQVKASVLLFSKKYRNSQSSSTPLILPDTQTSYNSRGGSTTTYGTQAIYLPHTDNYFDYNVSYFVKLKSFRLGIEAKDLSDSDKKALGTNKGIVVDLELIRK